ncbi:low-temperature-induced 65 kDa protein-like [Quercus suber]|uniref:low-temperature-induced 65 kDa protein-like n=1 Tax=Quercus suber TaxID=58331 RepID=UPI0032DEEEEE
MDSQVSHPDGHGTYEHDPHNVAVPPLAEGEVEHHHEKKSMLRKVKAKAKKIKETLTGHGHNHDHDHDYDYHRDEHERHIPDDHEEDDEDEELFEDPEVYGATKSASPVEYGKKIAATVTEKLTQCMRRWAEAVVMRCQKCMVVALTVRLGMSLNQRVLPVVEGQDKESYMPIAPGGEEAAGITPLLQSLDKMKVYDEPKPESAGTHHNLTTTTHNQFTNLPTGSHDQFSPEPVPPESQSIRDTPQLPESFAPNKPEDYIHEKPSNQSSYTEKISSATSAIADKVVSAKNVIASKLGYGEKDNNMSSEVHESGNYTKSPSESASPVEYGKKIAATVTEKLTPVYEKVAEAGSNEMSKVHGGGSDSTSGNVIESKSTTVVEGQDKGVSVKGCFMEKLRPGDEDRVPSEVISEALHKRNEEPEKAEKQPMGKVTESEEVARRLETKRDENCGESVQESFVDNQAQGSVVDRLRGAVGTWFGLSGDPQSQTPQQSHGVERISNSASGNLGYNSHAAEGRRLQESSN